MFIYWLFILTLAPNDPVPLATKLVVPILPTLALPDTDIDDSIPVLVMFGCALVVNAPATVVNIPPVAPMLPTLALPVVVLEPTILKYIDPSFVVCQVSVVSFQRNCTAGSSPRITRIPALLTGTSVVSALISMILSSTVNDATLKLPPPPLIVK